MKYDDASWHSGGNFPQDLSSDAGATHIGMFVAWALLSGLAGEIHLLEFPEDLARLRDRVLTPGQFFLAACDGKFTDEDLSETGNAFAAAYFDSENGLYLNDYSEMLGDGLPSLYHVPDSWSTFEKLKPVLDRRFSEWSRGG